MRHCHLIQFQHRNLTRLITAIKTIRNLTINLFFLSDLILNLSCNFIRESNVFYATELALVAGITLMLDSISNS
jgi:hypothetical protein